MYLNYLYLSELQWITLNAKIISLIKQKVMVDTEKDIGVLKLD